MKKINLSKIPSNPGCYLFKDNLNSIIYVGKAKNLKKRVKSYFQNKEQDEKTKAMISHINNVEFIVTDTEIESFLLENTLIKKNNPKYNINLKDSKRYAFIERTNEEFPRLIIARTKDVEGKLFGPFISASTRDEIIYLLNKIFKLRTCKRLPKKVCLRYSLEEFLSRYYFENKIPKAIILPKEIDESLIKYLELKSKQKVKIIIPKMGELKNLITLVKK